MNRCPRTLLAGALLTSLAAMAPAAATTQGFIRISGIQGPVKNQHHQHWSELATSDITIDSTPGQECSVLAEVLLKHAAPLALSRVGSVVPEVEIELETTAKAGVATFRALLENVRFNRVTTSSVAGRQIEELAMSPSRIEIETREIKPDGTADAPIRFSIDCPAGGRT